MTAYKGANVTKYDAGGSGDNYIADGYIKSVEKVWIDSLAFTSTTLTTADTITIAKIPPNKKITGVEVYFPSLTPTTSTINVGTSADPDKFIDDARAVGYVGASGAAIAALLKASMNNPDGFSYVTTGSTTTDIVLSLGVIALTAPTTGTITTIVRYT